MDLYMVQWIYPQTVGVMSMSIIAGLLVCAFVYVIKESISTPNEEEYKA